MVLPISNSNQNTHSGLKTGLGLTAFAVGGRLCMDQIVNKSTVSTVKKARGVMGYQLGVINGYKKLYKERRGQRPKIPEIRKEIKNAEKIRECAYQTARQKLGNRKLYKSINKYKSLGIAIPFYISCGAVVDYMNNRQKTNSEPSQETKKGNIYTKVNMGKKLGLPMGVLATVGMYGINNLVKNSKKAILTKHVLIGNAIAGFVLGALTDRMTNKKSRKLADKIT